ncbi:hypothetical protein MTR67_006740 [Solanum verrucosum]|uniref:Uncharacterized protein n=1 Tax=Solanum verrucosum TaxID=315347 RepID=A0AAF0Q0R4_SOLVR|nr:hypothetical protein MTR67_006740 [Solanum verrucosum]
MELHDPHLNGGKFSWFRGINHPSAARLDRFLYSMEWEEKFKNIRQKLLPRVLFDHCPILLESGNWEQKRSNFKFENWWLKVEGFTNLIQSWWNEFLVEGCPDYILNIKLRMLKQKLKEWSKSNFGELTSKKNSLLEELAEIDLIQETRELTEDEVIIRATIVVELEELAKNEESKWRQKSRVLWLKQGDNNTRFFQRMATAHRRINTIDRLIDRGEVVEDPVEIRNTVINFFKELYTESEEWRPNFDLMECPTISQEEKDWMQRPFTESEVLQCLQLCDGDKAPGQDGYTMSFFKSCWGIVKEDLMLTIHNFHQNGIFEKSFNATFLALIPKKPGAEELKDFRPISLIGGVYKIISKLITERLKTVMGKLVDVPKWPF